MFSFKGQLKKLTETSIKKDVKKEKNWTSLKFLVNFSLEFMITGSYIELTR